jgi:hypothetical protein
VLTQIFYRNDYSQVDGTIVKANDSVSLNNSNEVSFATNRVEELWTELSQAWPAVKNNPEIAEKIEKLWDILKSSGNDHLAISNEIQNLLDNNYSTTSLTSGSMKNVKPITGSQHSNTQADEDLDSLLAEILGENYQNETNQPVIQADKAQNIATTTPGSNSGTEELDKLVASILGDDWLKEDSGTTTASSSFDNQIPESTDNTKISNPTFASDHNIDNLVSSIIGDEANEESSKPYTSKITDETQDIDELLKNIIDEENLASTNNKTEDSLEVKINEGSKKETDFTSTTSNLSNNEEITPEDKPGEDIDNIINEILNKDTNAENTEPNISYAANLEQTQTAISKPEENIDDLINDIISDDTNAEDTEIKLNYPDDQEQAQIIHKEEKEDIDKLINEIINKDDDSESDAYNVNNITDEEQTQITGTNQEENIDDLIQDILENKTDTNIDSNKLNIVEEITIASDNTPYKKEKNSTVKKIITPPNYYKSETTSNKKTNKESSNALITIILIVLMFSFIGVWILFFNNEEVILADKTTSETYTNITSDIEEDSAIIEETTEEKYTAPTTKKYQYGTKPEYSTPKVEESTSYNESNYTAQIETNDNDITIILNSPETAIESDLDSTMLNPNETTAITAIEPLADDNFDDIEKITETTPPIETLSKNEATIKKAKKEKPVKTKPKRKIFIHKIVKGDTLWAIAKRYVNNPYRYPELAKLSKIKNPNRIYPGNKVKIIIYTK